MVKFKIPKTCIKISIILLVVFALGIGVGQKFLGTIEKNTPKAFISEIYDKIKENYWNNISDAELLDLFLVSIDKQSLRSDVAKFENKDKLLEVLSKTTAGMQDEQKDKFIVSVAASVLSSLNPAGRSGLYTQKNEEQLKNTVSNINPEKDLYKDLGLNKRASEAAVAQAYQKKVGELKNDNSKEGQEKLKQITYANNVLSTKQTKDRYDQQGIEPTVLSKILKPGILYLQFKKFSPTSIDEIQQVFDLYKNIQGLNALIFDLRGNIGGAIDETAYLLGYFLGKNQYAFDFYHKGEFLPFKTQTDKLPGMSKYKQVIILVDQNTQSSAEMMAGSLKKYHIGIVVGVPTKGWGTVERVFPLDNQISQKEKYSLFLVHSITLRDDNQPIEGRGIEPDVNIKTSDWQQQLFSYFQNSRLSEAVKELLFKEPL